MQETHIEARIHWSWYIPFVVLLVILLFLVAGVVLNSVGFPNSDFFTFWLSGRLASQGQNPYDSQAWLAGHHQFGVIWIPNNTFVYPLQVSLLFVPLGLMNPYHAFITWDILLQLMIISSVILLTTVDQGIPFKPYFLPIITGTVLFRPTIVTLLNGQVSGLLLLFITLTIVLWEKGKWEAGTVFLSLMALKPNLGVPLITLLTIYLVQQKKTKSLMTGVISALLLFGVGWMQNPNWLREFWNVGNTKISRIFGFSPTVWGVCGDVCDHVLKCTLSYGIFLVLLFWMAYLYLIIKKRDRLSPALVVSLAVVTMLLTTPSCWPYDQILLIAPIITVTMGLAKKGFPYLPGALIFLVVDILAWVFLGLAVFIQKDIWSASVPLIILVLLIWYGSMHKPLSLAAGE